MKIAIVTDPCYFSSGVKTYVDNLVENLLEIHNEIFVVHSRRQGINPFPSAKVIISPSLYRNTAATLALFDIHRPVLLRRHEFDIIHYTHNHVPLSFWASGSKVIVTIHGVASLSHPQFHSVASRFLWKVSSFLNRRVDIVVTDSNYAKEAIIQFLRVNPEKIRVIYHGISNEFKPLQTPEARKKLELKYGIRSPFILNVNGYQPIKNVATLAKAFVEIKRLGIQHQLVLVGRPIEQSHESIKIIKEAGLEKEVIITGYVPKEDLIAFYGSADLFVIASFKESFGLPLVEAFACGCPTLASNVTALPEIGGDASIFFNPYNHEELAKMMHEVLTNNNLRIQLKNKGLERALYYSWTKCAREHLAVYKEACRI